MVAEYPSLATAQDAGMTLGEYEEFIFDAVLRDWDAEGERMRRSPKYSTPPTRYGSSGPAPT